MTRPLSRRRFLEQLMWAGGAATLGGLSPAFGQAGDAAPGRKPNIIFIMADDLGWKDVGYVGADFFETPNIDKLAKTGMIFTNAYTCGPNCSSGRAQARDALHTASWFAYYEPGVRSLS